VGLIPSKNIEASHPFSVIHFVSIFTIMQIAFLVIGLVVGFLVAWLYLKWKQNEGSSAAINDHPLMKELRDGLATAEANIKGLREKLVAQDEQVQKIRQEFTKEFENLANRIFEDKSKKITEQNSSQLDMILSPLREKLKDFESKVEKVYSDENKERINLKAEIKMLSDLNKQLSSDANNLAVALKGDNKTQGNWGELILEKILERSGLREGVEYKTQETASNVHDDVIRPDVIVHLPDGKHLIVDSKVSLIAYNNMIAAANEDERSRYAKAHSESVRSHVKLLGDKSYQSAKAFNSPDFVILFMPMEAAFSAAMQADPELYSFAWDRKVVLVSPTTLLATLRTVSSIWAQENRTRNVEAIADEGGKLYDKFVAFVEDMTALGDRMKQLSNTYDGAMNKLSTGKGNLVSRAEKMKKLGSKNSKQLPKEILEGAGEEEES
jgi:DNA recombination protein RmuC